MGGKLEPNCTWGKGREGLAIGVVFGFEQGAPSYVLSELTPTPVPSP